MNETKSKCLQAQTRPLPGWLLLPPRNLKASSEDHRAAQAHRARAQVPRGQEPRLVAPDTWALVVQSHGRGQQVQDTRVQAEGRPSAFLCSELGVTLAKCWHEPQPLCSDSASAANQEDLLHPISCSDPRKFLAAMPATAFGLQTPLAKMVASWARR